jgi:Holliday junction resolvase
MSARSRNKGKRGELELARLLTAEGFPATRGAQHRGGTDSPDVIVPCLPGLHFEAKRTERLRLYEALAQAQADAGEKLPVVAWRRSHSDWLAVLKFTDLLAIVRESEYCMKG